jgi:uncharacterized protein (DUF433 family)
MSSETTQTEFAHIVRTPGIVGGEPRIADHRIRVRDIVTARDLAGYSPEEIAGTVYPDLTLAQVYAALAYYEDHRDEIDLASQSEANAADAFLRSHPDLACDRRPRDGSDK